MKNLWLHGIYLSIIGVLCFQLWSKTATTEYAFEQVERILQSDWELLDWNSKSSIEKIERNYSTNPNKYGYLIENAQEVDSTSQKAIAVIFKGFSDLKIRNKIFLNGMKDSLSTFSTKLNSIVDSEIDSIALMKHCNLNSFIKNDTFWRSFEMYPTAHLQILKNQIKLDELVYLNYIDDKVSRKFDIGCDNGFRIVIHPKKALLIEGEKFEAELYLTTYSPCIDGKIEFIVNNQNLPTQNGIVYFSSTETSIGLKTIKAQASVRNPATGESTVIKSVFEYHVLPKCSKNCQ